MEKVLPIFSPSTSLVIVNSDLIYYLPLIVAKIFAYVKFFFFILTMSIGILLCMISLALPGNSVGRNMRIRRNWLAVACFILGLKIDQEGRVPKGIFLFASNHRSFSDPMVALRFIYAWPLAKAEVSKYPLLGFGAKITGVLFVQRQSAESRLSARHAIRRTFESGQSVLIYPEGTTTVQSIVAPFKRGSFEVAAKMGIGVVPIAIEYRDPNHHWSNTTLLSHYLLQFGGRSRCRIGIGPPLISADANELRHYTETWVNQKLLDYRRMHDEE